MLIIAILLMVSGCANNTKKIGTYGTGLGKIVVHSFHTSHPGTPAVTGIVAVRNGEAKIVSLFNQKDLATVALEGLFGVTGQAAHGMTFGMFRRPDSYKNSTTVSGTSGSSAKAKAKAKGGSAEGGGDGKGGKGGEDKDNGNNGKGNGEDPQPPGDPKKND